MKNIFFGFGKLGATCLSLLIEKGFKIDYVFTHKDGGIDSVDQIAKNSDISFSYADLRKDNELLNELNLSPILYLISVNYRFILPLPILKNAMYPLNLHGSLLPKYRGRTPHVWSIIHGESKTGVTCHLMEESVDTGKIYHQIEVEITEEDTGFDLLQKFEKVYPDCLFETLNKIKNGFNPISQDEKNASYYGKRIPEMGYIDFHKDCYSIINFIRAQSEPYPGAYTYLPNGKMMIINHAIRITDFNEDPLPIGITFSRDGKYFVKTLDGFLLLDRYELS